MDERGASTHRSETEKAAVERGAHFKRVVRAAMVKQGLKDTDSVLASRTGLSENTIRSLWRGHGAEVGTLIAVANGVEMSVLDILLAMQGRPVVESQPPALDRIAVEIRALRELLAGAGEATNRAAIGAVTLGRAGPLQGLAAAPSDEPAASSQPGKSDEETLPR